MAKYTVTSGCGHTTTVQLYGPVAERKRRIAWMQSAGGQCNPCYAAAQQAERAEQVDAAVRRLADEIRGAVDGGKISEADIAEMREQAAARSDEPQARRIVAALDLLGY